MNQVSVVPSGWGEVMATCRESCSSLQDSAVLDYPLLNKSAFEVDGCGACNPTVEVSAKF